MSDSRPAELLDQGPVAPAHSIYVHFPWCRHRCAYCDFATTAARVIPRQAYLQAIRRDLDRRVDLLGPVQTLFFGGGTPSLWGPEPVAAVIAAIDAAAGLTDDAEITLEANPGASGPADLAGLAAAGINRISLGVQALDDGRLQQLDRIHDADAARLALAEVGRLLADGGLRSASADLLLGAPGQTVAHLADELNELLDYGLPHLSAYTLTVEPGTPLSRQVANGRARAPNEGLQTEMLMAMERLVAPWGLRRYEVSNLAQPGHESRHNLACWRGQPYVGLGTAAHGFARLARGSAIGWRWGNLADANGWQRAIGSGAAAEAFVEVIDPEMHLDERVLTGLRLAEGLDLESLRADLPADLCQRLESRAAELIAAGEPLELVGGRLHCRPSALPRLDGLIVSLLA